MTESEPTGTIQILIPVFNDWDSLALLIPQLERALSSADLQAELLVVDDGSTDTGAETIAQPTVRSAIARIRVITLRRNMGHQRAIAVGLCYIEAHLKTDMVVVMDGDGEDDPEDVPRLIEKVRREGGRKAVFARRKRRAEGIVFRIFYQFYRMAHRLAVGCGIQIGNFSALPFRHLTRLVAVAELWNHYAAAATVSRLPMTTLDSQRRIRLSGQSKMNFVSLVTHGLSAISVYGETVGTRMFAMTGAAAGLFALAMIAVIVIRLFTTLAIPGWATTSLAFLLVLIVQTLTVGFLFTFVVLNNRSHLALAPLRVYRDYVLSVREVGVALPSGSDAESRR